MYVCSLLLVSLKIPILFTFPFGVWLEFDSVNSSSNIEIFSKSDQGSSFWN